MIGSVHKLRQLIPWSATAGDDQINLEYALHMGTALKHYRLVEKAAETADVDLSTLSPEDCKTLLANAAAGLGQDYKDAAAAVRELVAPSTTWRSHTWVGSSATLAPPSRHRPGVGPSRRKKGFHQVQGHALAGCGEQA